MDKNTKLLQSVQGNFEKAFNELQWYYENKNWPLKEFLAELQEAPVIFDKLPDFYKKLVTTRVITEDQVRTYLKPTVKKLEAEIIGGTGDGVVSIFSDQAQIYRFVNKCIELRKKYGKSPDYLWEN